MQAVGKSETGSGDCPFGVWRQSSDKLNRKEWRHLTQRAVAIPTLGWRLRVELGSLSSRRHSLSVDRQR
jgi:hypothetical protein